MKEIDINNWKRKSHYVFFSRSELPFYNINFIVDITGVREIAKENSWSLNSTLMFVTIRALNKIEDFRYRLRGETLILHDRLNPSFAHIKEGDDLFSLITLDFVDDPGEFDKAVKQTIAGTNEYFDLSKLIGRDDFVFFSSMPWIPFTSIDHTLCLNRDDAVPRITWGKFFESDNRVLLPYNIRVNHRFVDGIHVGLFFEELGKEINICLNSKPNGSKSESRLRMNR